MAALRDYTATLLSVMRALYAQGNMKVKKNIIKGVKVGGGALIGTTIYQIASNSEPTFDFYRPIFVGIFVFIFMSIFYALTSSSKG